MKQPIERRVALPVQAESRDPDPSGGPDDGLAMISRLADDLLPTLITRVDASSLGELEVRRNGWRIRLRRQPANVPDQADGLERSQRSSERTSEGGHPEAAANMAPDRSARHDDARTIVTSPAVGYYVARNGVSVGMHLRGGDLLGHVDVLGVQVEVVAPTDGRLTRLLAEPGEAVEFGQALARLEAESQA